MNPKFLVGQKVTLVHSGAEGVIKGIKESPSKNVLYYVRYINSIGYNQLHWIPESNLEKR